jgi:hypothetical protein
MSQVRRLDGVEVTAGAKGEAEDAYVAQVLRFNEKVEQVRPLHDIVSACRLP